MFFPSSFPTDRKFIRWNLILFEEVRKCDLKKKLSHLIEVTAVLLQISVHVIFKNKNVIIPNLIDYSLLEIDAVVASTYTNCAANFFYSQNHIFFSAIPP